MLKIFREYKMKCNLIHRTSMLVIKFLSTVCLLLTLITPSQAANSVESNETLPAVGRMPVTSSSIFFLSPKTPKDNETVTFDIGKYSQTDADSDEMITPYIEWLIDDVSVGIGPSYTFDNTGYGGQQLSIRLIPKTLTGDPNAGAAISSEHVRIGSSLIGNFSTPDTVVRNWTNADLYCKNMEPKGSWSLPSLMQLRSLFYSATSLIAYSGTTIKNYDMCNFYGWPLLDMCGGTNSVYWTSEEQSLGRHTVIGMDDGISSSRGDSGPQNVVCVSI